MPRSSGYVFAGSRDGRTPSLLKSGLLIVMVVAALVALFWGGEVIVRYIVYRLARADTRFPVVLSEPVRDVIRNTYHQLPHSKRRAALEKSGMPVYDLRITPKNLQRLRHNAELIGAVAISEEIPREYVNAEFLMGGKWIPIQVKLRGLTKKHYTKMMFSMRLKFPKDRLFDGKKQINLSFTYDKGLTFDTTTNWELRRHGILTWDDAFVVVRINGDTVGIYQEIEHFGRSMMDGNGRPEGYIFSGYGQLFGKEGTAYGKARAAIEQILPWDKAEEQNVPANGNWRFLQEYFDTDRMAWAAAMMAALGSAHAWDGDNLRFYWDPAYGQFEPIPWDFGCFPIDPDKCPDGETTYHRGFGLTFCGIPEFRRMRDTRLWTILTDRIDPYIDRANQLFSELTPWLTVDVRHPTFGQDKREHERQIQTLRFHREFLTRLFKTHDVRATFWRTDGAGLVLNVENHGKAFVRVTGIAVSDGAKISEVALAEPIIADGVWLEEPGRAKFTAPISGSARPTGLIIRNGVTGEPIKKGELKLSAGTGPAPIPDRKPILPRLKLAIKNVQVKGNTVILGPGRVELTSTVELPRDYDIVFKRGLDLVLDDKVALVGYGNLTAIGTADEPIRIGGSNAEQQWGGIALQGTRVRPVTVNMEHTIVEGGTGTQNRRTYFTSPFAVHGGIVNLHNCQFRNSRTDDGINLKYCQIQLHGNLFRGSKSDAVDLDFCNGEVIGNRVEGAGGDGLDVSGARVTMAENYITRCADKGISIGEGSNVVTRNNYITHCYTGIASKDLSKGHISQTGMAYLEVGVAVYVKKPSFGPSSILLEHVAMCDVRTAFLRDSSCELKQTGSIRYHSGELHGNDKTIPIETKRVAANLTPAKLQALLSADEINIAGIKKWDHIPK